MPHDDNERKNDLLLELQTLYLFFFLICLVVCRWRTGGFPCQRGRLFFYTLFFFLFFLYYPSFFFFLNARRINYSGNSISTSSQIYAHTHPSHTKKKTERRETAFFFLSTAHSFLSLAYSSRSTYTKGNQTTLQTYPHTQTKSAFSLWFTAFLFETPPLHSVFYLLIRE